MLPTTLILLISTLLSNITPGISQQITFQHPRDRESQSLNFKLRHVHAVTNVSSNIFSDVRHDGAAFGAMGGGRWGSGLKMKRVDTHRPQWSESLDGSKTRVAGWELEPIEAPDVTDRATVYELAAMTNNAYVDEEDPAWYPLDGKWAHEPFGWEPDADGFRGHIFVTEDNSTVILTIKGTSPSWPFGSGPTGVKDKLNDNLLFSCCCARVSWTWTTVCGCYIGGSQCGNDCIEEALIEESLFYSVGINLYNNVSYMYPDANIWVTGHSLGGALASMIGVTFGLPAVTFEAPGEALAARRLHLPMPPSIQHVTHFFHTADPIAMGTCNGALSSCSLAGYAMETRCHLGQVAIFDTINEMGWSSDIRMHGIVVVIDKLLAADGDWFNGTKSEKKKRARGGKEGSGRTLPVPVAEEEDCLASECFRWDFV